MAGLFAYAAAGLAEGVGDTFVQRAKDKKEAAREELRFQRDEKVRTDDRKFRGDESAADRELRKTESAADRDLRISESGLDRDLRRGESAADRDLRISEGQKDRDLRRSEADSYSDTFTGGDGYIYERPKKGGAARRITDESGNPIKASPAKSTNPITDRKDLNELITKEAKIATGAEPDQQSYNFKPEDLVDYNARLLENYNRLRAENGMGPVTAPPNGAKTEMPTTVKLPEAAATPAADRVDGKEYSHNGKIYIWRATDGKWEPK